MVVFPGISVAEKVAEKYKLRHHREIVDERNRLILHYIDQGDVPWIFTKHWTGSRGLSNVQKAIMKTYIHGVL